MSVHGQNELVDSLTSRGLAVDINKPMALLTTYGVGGHADVAVTVKTEADILATADVLSRYRDVDVVVLGRGSNTLFADTGFRGVVVILGASEESRSISIVEGHVRASGAMLMPVLARRTVQSGYGGLEWCVGIPGTVGGAVRMNAGGHGADIADSLVNAQVVSLRSGQHRTIDVADLGLHFRGSALSPHHVVTSALFRVSSVSPEVGARHLDEIVAWRREHQPGGRNAGSVFVNPAPDEGSAGSLIDQCGLRGFAVGGAHVSDKHANFIQASDGATADDVLEVMRHVQLVVEQTHGVRLRSEVRLVGCDDVTTVQFADDAHNNRENLEARHNLCEMLGEEHG